MFGVHSVKAQFATWNGLKTQFILFSNLKEWQANSKLVSNQPLITASDLAWLILSSGEKNKR